MESLNMKGNKKIIVFVIIMIPMILLNSQSLICKSDYDKILEFLKDCSANFDQLESIIKQSDYYDEDTDISDIQYCSSLFKQKKSKYFIYLGLELQYIKKSNKYLYLYKIEIDSLVSITFDFEMINNKFYLRYLTPTYSGDINIIQKTKQIKQFIEDMKTIKNFQFDKAYFDYFIDTGNMQSFDERKLYINRKLFNSLRFNFDNQLCLIENQSIGDFEMGFTNILTYYISKDIMIKFRYHLNLSKLQWELIDFELMD